MNNSYSILKQILDEVYAKKRSAWAKDALEILKENNIKLRDKDGQLNQVNFSIPTSKQDVFVLGLRYVKKDGTFTEDLFVFEKGLPIKSYYKGKLEQIFIEYTGTHKKQIV